MAQLPERDAANKLLDVLSRPMPPDEQLDALIPDYVEAELAGKDAPALFPEVHAYIVSNDAAGELYAALLDAEMIDRSRPPKVPDSASVPFKPDLSFLKDQPDAGGALTVWQQRIVDLAQQLARTLQPKLVLHFEDFVEYFFDMRADYPDEIALKPGVSNAFAAVDGDVPDELRWLEATYQFARLRATANDPARLAQTVASNAGLPKQVHKRFVELILAWTDQ